MKIRYTILLIILFLTVDTPNASAQEEDLDVPYVPTPQTVVDKMLDMANVTRGDYVMDLGSGDGRIVISAASRGATGLGVDLDPERIGEARNNVEEENVSDRVMFKKQDIFKTDISAASAVTLYLLSSVNRQLRPTLMENLEPGTPVVSHRFDMGDWEADSVSIVTVDDRTHEVYLWIIPAEAGGEWNWQVDSKNFSLSIDQSYQEIEPELSAEGDKLSTKYAVLKGRRITIMATEDGKEYMYSGRIENNTINGIVQIRTKQGTRVINWEASRDTTF